MKKQTLAQVKALAKKGPITVTLFPSKCGPTNTTWVKGMELDIRHENNEFFIGDEMETLQSALNAFMYYNCNAQLGNRVHFYIKEDHNL